MLENEDIQHILLTRTPALTGRYEFLSFRNAAGGRAWLSAIREKAQSAAEVMASVEKDKRWVTVAFTWNGLRALGVDEGSLATFPEEFKQGMVARSEMLGDTGENHPDNWVGGLARPDLHAIAILFARDAAERGRCQVEHDRLVAQCQGVEVLSTLDLEATPPFDYAHDHFGYRDRLSQPVIEGTGEVPTPGTGAPLKPGEFILGYPDEDGPPANLPQPEILSRNGSYMAYRRLQEHVGRFRDFLREHGETREEQELIAAKLMGRWRSGAPLTLAPEKDDPALGADLQRNNDFNYKEMDPHGYAVPLGSHMRRMNPRDTAANMNRRRMIRRGATYGPHLPEDVPEDGVERGNEHTIETKSGLRLRAEKIVICTVQVASIFNAFGSRIQLFQTGPRILPSEDEDVSAAVAAAFRSANIAVHENIGAIEGFEKTPTGVRMIFSRDGVRDSAEATLAVVAVGWVADTAGLSLASVSVETDHRGFVKVDEYLRTSKSHIFAAGDITGRLMLVPQAIRDGFVAATNAVRGSTMTIGDPVSPIGSFTDPEYAQVGLTEAKARKTHDIEAVMIRFDSTTRTIIDGHKIGFCKLIVDRETHRILGCHVVGERG